jgi:hypothetical protein
MEINITELAALLNSRGQTVAVEHPFNLGKNYFIRTVTHHHTGKLVQVTPTELVLENAAWIADDGRLTDALKTGTFNEVEMFPPDAKVIIGRGSLIDAVEVPSIPTSQK